MTPAGQRWTRNFPSVSGWYWFRSGMTPRPVVKVGFPYGHLTIEGEYESMADELDRLASEGA